MARYTPEQVQELHLGAQRWISESIALVRRVSGHQFVIPEARRIAIHGLSRRLAFIPHAIDRIFTEVPPDEENPAPTAVTEITLHLQAASIHAFGAIDNLAQIWCAETQVTEKDGRALHHTQIGFGPMKAAVRATLTGDLRTYVEEEAFAGWFDYLEAFRHAIAHRDPLYVPPRTMSVEDHDEYRRLEGELAQVATILDGRWDEIWGAMHSLGRFEPMMVPNLTDEIRPVYFHGQVICDLSTVVDLGNRVFDALDTRRAAQA